MRARVGIEKLAQELKLTKSRLYQLIEGGMPRTARGKYDLYQCVRWYALYLQEALRRKEFSKNKEQERLTRVKADLGELELAKVRAELIPIALYQELVSNHVMVARRTFLVLPSRIAPQLEGKDRASIKAKLDQAVHGALTALSQGENGPEVEEQKKRRDDGRRFPARAPARSAAGQRRPGPG